MIEIYNVARVRGVVEGDLKKFAEERVETMKELLYFIDNNTTSFLFN